MQIKRVPDETQCLIKCYIFPSIISINNDNYIWNNKTYESKYKLARESDKNRDFLISEDEKEPGIVVLKNIDYENRNAMFSLRLFSDLQDEKILEKTVSTLFKHFDLVKLYGVVLADNPFIKLIEDSGFQKEGELRKNIYVDGEFKNQLLYSIFCPESEINK